MRFPIAIVVLSAGCMLAACGPSDKPKVTPPASTEAKTEAPHAPDTHGMPGMSELFKGDEKKPEEKKDDKK